MYGRRPPGSSGRRRGLRPPGKRPRPAPGAPAGGRGGLSGNPLL